MQRFLKRIGLASLAIFSVFSMLAEAGMLDSPPAAHVVDADGRQPQVALGPGGRIYVAFGRANEVRLAASGDGGRNFEVSTVGEVGALSLGMRRGPRVAASDDAVVVTAIGGNQGMGRDGDVLAWRSSDGGRTWAGPRRLNSVEGSAREGLHGMAAGPGGRMFCTWLDLRAGRTEIYGSVTRDGGATWEKDSLIYRSPDGSVCECCHPSAAYGADGTLYVMWRNSLGGSRDLYLTSSADDGKTFRPAEKLGRETWPLKACPMDGGAVAVGPEGGVETVWMRAGSMFAARPGEAERPLGRGVQGWAAMGAGGLQAVWLQGRPGRLLHLAPGSATPRVLAERAVDPAIAAALGGRGPVVVVWEVPAGGKGIEAAVIDPGR